MTAREIGEKIKTLRKDKGITRQNLADYLEISYSALSNYENGNRKIPIEILVSISQYFNVEFDFFLSKCTDYQEWVNQTYTAMKAIRSHSYDDYIEMMSDFINRNDASFLYREAMRMNDTVIPREFLISYYEELNNEGKEEAIKRVEELTHIPKYTKKEDK